MRWARLLHNPERFLFLSDGIFAIAMTLMAIDVAVSSNLSHAQLTIELSEWAHRILVYALSFYLLARYWVGHVARFEHIRAMDRPLLGLSLASLAIVALVPPTTAMISDYPDDSRIVSIYMGCLAILGLVDFMALHYASTMPDLLARDLPTGRAAFWLKYRLLLPGIALVCLVVAQYEPLAALYSFFGMVILLDLSLRRPGGVVVEPD